MESVPDWITLWRQLAGRPPWNRETAASAWTIENDPYRQMAQHFDADMKQRGAGPDLIRDFVASQVDGESTVVDIGAGTGRITMYLAPRVRKVTAIEPSPSMAALLKQNLAGQRLYNVDIVEGFWPEVATEAHDVSFCAHAMYSSPDLPSFVNRMSALTRRLCCLILRIPSYDGIMADASRYIYGQPHDSPSFIIAYNALIQLGIYPNVLIDPHSHHWTSDTVEDALTKVKDRLGILETSEHDDYFKDLLRRRLSPCDGRYVWPDEMRAAMAYWKLKK